MKVWVDCTAAAHPLVLRPIDRAAGSAGGRGVRHRARVRADAGDARAAGDPVHVGRQPRRRLDAAARGGRWPGARRGLARLVWERRPDLAIAHGSVDLAVVSGRLPDPLRADAGLRVRRAAAPDRLPGGAPGAGPRTRSRSSGCGGSAPGRASWSATRASRRSTTWPASSPTRACSTSSGSTARRCWSSSARRRRPPSTTPATTSTARRSERLAGEPGAQAVVIPRTERQGAEARALGAANLIVPERAIDAQSLIAFADLVVSAGGTMNREAVALGTPVFTTFTGRDGRRRRGADRGGTAAGPRRPGRAASCASARRRSASSIRATPSSWSTGVLGAVEGVE